jgi:hypothetical protein
MPAQSFLHHIEMLKKKTLPHAKSIFITNINVSRMENQEYYCLVVDPQKLMFAEKKPFYKRVLQFDLVEHSFTDNAEPKPLTDLPELVERIHGVLDDLDQHKARVYEKAIESL